VSTTAVPSQTAASDTSVAKVDMKLEVVVIPVSHVDRASSSMADSAGGSMPTSAREAAASSSSRHRARSVRFNSART
jgi:hypothetical protein